MRSFPKSSASSRLRARILQPIENRILMLSTGIRAQVGIKILGSDLETIQQVAFKIEDLVRQVPGAMGVAASRTQGKPYVEILPDRLALARYGLSIRDLMDVVGDRAGWSQRQHDHRRSRQISDSRFVSRATNARTSNSLGASWFPPGGL